MNTETVQLAGLTARILGPASAPITAVMLHGFGASGDDLVPLAHELDAPVRFVFPAAPIELGGPFGGGRAWWRLDLEQLERDLRAGKRGDRTNEVPDGIEQARAQLSRFLDELEARYAFGDEALVLGGFSQGAMLSLDVALHRDVAPAALVLMSGTLLAQHVWVPRMSRLAGRPIAMSHGHHDPLLPFGAAELLRDHLRTAGANVELVEFAGGHEIPMQVLEKVSALLGRVASER